jgi:two-component system NarL family sensor kinase
MLAKIERLFNPSRIFTFLVAYRWASLLPAFWILIGQWGNNFGDSQHLSQETVFGLALLLNIVITLFNRKLNHLVVKFPLALTADLLFSAGIMALSGGSHSPYYLYALSPLLAGTFFFQMRGALISAAVFTPLYFASDFIGHQLMNLQPSESVTLLTHVAGIWLIPILFAYPSVLLREINRARDELSLAHDKLGEQNENLSTAHRQLRVIHDLTVLLQAAPDLLSVQQRVLGAVTTGLGFRKAIVGLVDPALDEMGNWLLYPVNSSFPVAEPLPLKPENGAVFESLLEQKPYRSGALDETLIADPALNSWLKTSNWMVLPLSLREHMVGVLLVEINRNEGLTRQREEVLTMVSNQAALALGTTILCIDRAQRLAVETERNRIARDIHDTVAQSLFGIVYSLDACITMLPAQADEVRSELIELRTLASGAHDEVRRSIFDLWPSSLTLDLFTTDLKNYVNQCCRPRRFDIEFKTTGDFNRLSSGLRRTIYRMAQEALANSARHSGANSAQLCMHIADDMVYINIEDHGRGFDPSKALERSHNREHFGLHGINERVIAMGGDCEIISAPGEGARVIINLPVHGQKHA